MRQALNRILLLFIIINIFSSCKNEEDKTLNVFSVLDHSLVMSSLNIEASNNTIYHSFASRAEERRTTERAKIWQAKALMIKSLSDKEYDYIEQLKKELKEQAGRGIIKEKEIFQKEKEVFEKDNRNAATVIYNKSGEELLKRLKQYKILVMQVDPGLKNNFEKTIPIYFPEKYDQVSFKNDYFRNVTAISAVATLSCFQNKIRNTENVLIDFCYQQIFPTILCGFGRGPFFLVSQNSSYVKKGQKIIITSGLGTFSPDAEPVYTIAGKKRIPKENGPVIYEFKAASVPGEYRIPVAVEFLDENGNKKTMTKEIVYEVAKDPND